MANSVSLNATNKMPENLQTKGLEKQIKVESPLDRMTKDTVTISRSGSESSTPDNYPSYGNL